MFMIPSLLLEKTSFYSSIIAFKTRGSNQPEPKPPFYSSLKTESNYQRMEKTLIL